MTVLKKIINKIFNHCFSYFLDGSIFSNAEVFSKCTKKRDIDVEEVMFFIC